MNNKVQYSFADLPICESCSTWFNLQSEAIEVLIHETPKALLFVLEQERFIGKSIKVEWIYDTKCNICQKTGGDQRLLKIVTFKITFGIKPTETMIYIKRLPNPVYLIAIDEGETSYQTERLELITNDKNQRKITEFFE